MTLKSRNNSPTFGTRHKFTFGEGKLLIKEKKWFRLILIRTMELSDIQKIEYVKPDYKPKTLIKRFLGRLLILFLPNFFHIHLETRRSYLRITYKVNGDEAIGGFVSKISNVELAEMKLMIPHV